MSKYKRASEMPEATEEEINRKWKCLVAEDNDYRAIKQKCDEEIFTRRAEMTRLANKVRAIVGCAPVTLVFEPDFVAPKEAQS